MSEMKRLHEQEHPETFSPQALPPGSDQGAVDYEQFLFAVEAEENRIISEEGIWTVGGQYFANSEDASMQRTWLAEKRVEERAASMDRYLARGRRAS